MQCLLHRSLPVCISLLGAACGGTSAAAPPPRTASLVETDAATAPTTAPATATAPDAAYVDASPQVAAPTEPARLRFVHAAADRNLPVAEVHYHGATAAAVTALAYLHADGYSPIAAGPAEVTVLRDGSPPTATALLDTTTTPLAAGHAYTAVLYGTSMMYSPGLLLTVAEDTAPVLPPERAAIRFFHAYIADPLDACVDGRPLAANLVFGAWYPAGGYHEINPGSLQVQLRRRADGACAGATVATFSLAAPSGSRSTLVIVGANVPPDAATHSGGAHKQRRRDGSAGIGREGTSETDLLAVIRCSDPPARDTGCHTLAVQR